MIMDLHNHTRFSYDSTEEPEVVIENAIAHGIDAVGITDHQFSIGGNLGEYIREIKACAEKFADRITVFTGLEIGTRPRPTDLFFSETQGLDYVLFECLDDERSMDFFEFLTWRKRFKCPVGLAHCDIFKLGMRYGLDMPKVLKSENIFWELNTSGNYIYYYDFLTSAEKRGIIKESGIGVSVGSDTHELYRYREKQLKNANRLVEETGLPLPFNMKHKPGGRA